MGADFHDAGLPAAGRPRLGRRAALVNKSDIHMSDAVAIMTGAKQADVRAIA